MTVAMLAASLAAAERQSDGVSLPMFPATMAAVLIAACGSAEMAMAAMRAGAFDRSIPFWQFVHEELATTLADS